MNVVARHLGCPDYTASLQWMREFVDARTALTPDEFWLLEHPRVFTQGQAGRAAHVHDVGDIPIIQSDRGGQVTYHGPGQLVIYTLIDLRRLAIGPRELVKRIEAGIIEFLRTQSLTGVRRAGAPGVYIDDAKIAALGLRIRRGSCYHGLAFNVDVDLEPFSRIDPCGYQGLRVTRLHDCGVELNCATVGQQLLPCLLDSLYGTGRVTSIRHDDSRRREGDGFIDTLGEQCRAG